MRQILSSHILKMRNKRQQILQDSSGFLLISLTSNRCSHYTEICLFSSIAGQDCWGIIHLQKQSSNKDWRGCCLILQLSCPIYRKNQRYVFSMCLQISQEDTLSLFSEHLLTFFYSLSDLHPHTLKYISQNHLSLKSASSNAYLKTYFQVKMLNHISKVIQFPQFKPRNSDQVYVIFSTTSSKPSTSNDVRHDHSKNDFQPKRHSQRFPQPLFSYRDHKTGLGELCSLLKKPQGPGRWSICLVYEFIEHIPCYSLRMDRCGSCKKQ